MVEHERTHTAVPDNAAPDTDPIPVQRPTEPALPARPVEQAYRKARHASGWWARMAIAAVVFVVLLVFIVENLGTVDIAFFGIHGHLPLGVALLVAAVCGSLLILVPSYHRISQLRRTLRRAAHGK